MHQRVAADPHRDFELTAGAILFKAANAILAIVATEDDLLVFDRQFAVGGSAAGGVHRSSVFHDRFFCG